MDSGAVRLLGMGELYFSPSSASYLACDPQGVTCSDAAFARYKVAHILILTDMGRCHQWVKQINEKLDRGGVLLVGICQERSIGAITLLPPLVSLNDSAAIHDICNIFSLAGPSSTDVPAVLHPSPVPYPWGLHVSDSDLRYFRLIQSNLSVSV